MVIFGEDKILLKQLTFQIIYYLTIYQLELLNQLLILTMIIQHYYYHLTLITLFKKIKYVV